MLLETLILMAQLVDDCDDGDLWTKYLDEWKKEIKCH